MSAVGVRELKNRLTHYLRRAKLGDGVVVTQRGKPVALLQPVQSAPFAASREARLARLAAQGLILLPTRRPSTRVRLVRITGRPLSRTVLDGRR